jgi:DNA-binding response OmpR family regulator
MTDETNVILTVDDEPEILAFLEIHLATAGYSIIKATTGKEALNILEQDSDKIKAIISDVEMPEMNGYELCEKVRENDKLKSLPFIFVSSHTELDDKLKGYAVGGDEYITKPLVDPNELIIKTKNFIENNLQHASLTKQLSDSFNTTMQSMTYSSYLGQVLQFLQDSSHLSSLADVANRLLETTENLGINAVIQFRSPNGHQNFRKNGTISPLEENIIQLAQQKNRFFDFDARTIITYEHFSLLIKNMPIDNPEAYGTMKDVLGNLCNAIDTITEIILAKEMISQKITAMSDVNMILNEIESTLTTVQDKNTNVLEDMINEIDDTMMTIGITDQQEEKIRSITEKCLTRSNEVLEKASTLKESLRTASKALI